jgi:MFS transporter, FHS family, glucose/mannose:H+ symporter
MSIRLSSPASAPGASPSVSAQPQSLQRPEDARFEWILLHIGFVAVGIITTLIGNVLPSFIRHWSLTDAQAGFLIAAQFSGSSLGTALTSVLLPRFGFSRVLCAGFTAFAVGFSFLGLGPWSLAALSVFVYGFGYGLVNPATNLRSTQLPSRNMASAVSFLNFSWTVGAVSCPFVVGQLLPRIGIRGIAISLTIITLVIGAFHAFRHSSAPKERAERATRPWAEWMRALGTAPSISLTLLFFLYVGTEVGVGNWVATQERRMLGLSTTALFLAPSFFYGFLLLGRGISPLVLRRLTTKTAAIAGLVSAALGAVIIIFSQQPGLLYTGAAFAGLGCAPQYPILVTWLAQIFRENATWLSALFFGAAGAGGAVVPWLMGIVASQTHSLRVGFALPFIACVAMATLAARIHPTDTAAKGGAV